MGTQICTGTSNIIMAKKKYIEEIQIHLCFPLLFIDFQ